MSCARRLCLASLALLAAGLLVPAAAHAASAWPMFGRDAAHSRRSTVLGAQTATLKWARSLTANGWVFSSPALASDGTVYITAQDFTLAHDQLYALDPSNGSVKWHTDAGDSEYSSPAVAADGAIYLGGYLMSAPTGQQGTFFAFGPSGGDPTWTFVTSSAFDTSPVVDASGAIYIGADDSDLYRLSPTGDHLVWGSPVGGFAGLESSPALDGDGAVYIGTNNQKMCAFDTVSPGTRRWSVTTIGSVDVGSSPALSDDRQTVYFADDGGTVYALAAGTGVEKWHHSGLGTVSPSQHPSSPAVGADGTVYVGGADGKVYALNAGDGTTKWSYQSYKAICSSPAIGGDGTVYVGSDDYNFYALNGSTGKLKWWYQTGAAIKSSPAIGADGTVYVGSTDGKLYAFGGSGGSTPQGCTLSTPRASGALKHTVAVTYGGTLTPKRVTRVTLTFQRFKKGKWKAALSASTSTNAAGAWTYRKKLGAGKYRLKASTAATSIYKAAVSGWKTVTIR